MIIAFTQKDLISFGQYLMSERRRKSFTRTSIDAEMDGRELPPTNERLKNVYHADVENWMAEQ